MNIYELIGKYRKFLETNYSTVTVKNYLSDINHFASWCDKNKNIQDLIDLLSKSVLEEYITQENQGEDGLSHKSLKRHLSSLRNFTSYLVKEGYIEKSPFTFTQPETTLDPWSISEYKNYLFEKKAGNLTVKYYVNDIKSFAKWCEKTNPGIHSEDSSTPVITDFLISEYTNRLRHTLFLSPKSINRKLSSIRSYAGFLRLKLNPVVTKNIPLAPEESVVLSELIATEAVKNYSKFAPLRLLQKSLTPYTTLEGKIAHVLSSQILALRLQSVVKSDKNAKVSLDNLVKGVNVKNIKKEFYAPHEISLDSFSLKRKVMFHLKNTRPNWYKKYHNYPFVHYLHFAVLVVFAFVVSAFFYNQTLGKAKAEVNSGSLALHRTFAFNGRLTDKSGNPITEKSDLRLSLYSDPNSSGSALLWEEVQSSVIPAEDGSISLIIGSMKAIPEEYFSTNTPLYLGITIGTSEELYPRKQIGVPYASNADRLNGLLPITASSKQTNVILALDASGNLSIGGNGDHTFEATGGLFTLSGQALLLTTSPDSHGNVVINPYGNGKIELKKSLVNPDGVIKAEGSVEISATTSASPVLALKQDSGGDFITASTAGTTRFTVNNQGVVTKGIWAGEPIGTEFGGFGANISATGPGELLYSTGTKSYGHLAAGQNGQCLMSTGRSAPLWSTCGFLSQVSGVLSLSNNTVDFLLGATSTGSAKFAFTNMITGNPIFKIGGNLSLTAEGVIETNDKDLKIGGNKTKNIIINTSSNVGVGNTNPSRSFDVSGNWGGNVDYHSDGATTQTITRDTKALVYDLEKNTGTTNTSTTTTYNIVGLPNVNGTFAFVYAKVAKDATAGPQTQTIVIQVNGTTVSTLSTEPNPTLLDDSSVVKHFTLTRSNDSWHLIGDPGNSDTADLAEWTPYSGETPLPGELVTIGEDGKLKKSDTAYDPKIAGAVSTKPNITIGLQSTDSVRLGLSGRIPMIVTSINGSILAGDSITSSPIVGTGMRLNRPAATVGKTLEAFTPSVSKCTESESLSQISWPRDDGRNLQKPCFKIKVSHLSSSLSSLLLSKYGLTSSDYIYIGKVMVLADVSWSDSEDLISSLESATISNDEMVDLLDGELTAALSQLEDSSPVVKIGGRVIDTTLSAASMVVGKIKTGTLTAGSVGAKTLFATRGVIENLTVKSLSVTDSLLINGLSLKDYIAQEFSSQKEITSPLASIDTVKTDTITPKSGNVLTVSLSNASDSALLVKNSDTQETVAQINASGDATFSGSLSSESLNASSASVSGTLTTDTLVAKEIAGLDDRVTDITTKIIASQPKDNLPSVSFVNEFAQASVSANFATFYEGLLSLGASTFGNLSVIDELSVGTTLTLSPNSINTLGVTLEIQPLRQGAVSFLAGAVVINIDGTLTVSENALFNKNVSVKGKLSANILSPLPESDLEINLPKGETKESNLQVKDASNSAVFTVSQKGDVNASGSGTFSKLKFNVVGQALASSLHEAVASGSAGTAVLSANTIELTILNPLVGEDSLIYITPANSTQNQVLYLMRQVPNTSFTVGLSQPVTQDIIFNWLIVN